MFGDKGTRGIVLWFEMPDEEPWSPLECDAKAMPSPTRAAPPAKAKKVSPFEFLHLSGYAAR